MYNNKKHVAVVLAAGKGSRMNSDVPKQYMELSGKPVLYYSIKAFEESAIDEIVLVVGKDEVEYCRTEIVGKYNFSKVTHIVEGGAERYFSVLNGIRAVKNCDYIHIHDGARPCVSQNTIKKCIEEVQEYDACVTAVPVKDTIKISDENGYAVSTPDRNYVWQVQTPQSFKYNLVEAAYELMAADTNRGNITDDAMVVEKYTEHKVKFTMGEYENIKITTPMDLCVAKLSIINANK